VTDLARPYGHAPTRALDGGTEWGEDRARTAQKGGREMEHALMKTICLLTMLAIPAMPIAAQADKTADSKAEAKKHFDRAMELNEDGQTAEAVVELKRCYEIAPHHTVLYNMGQAYITLAKPVEAVAALQRYLDEGGKAIKADRRTEVEQDIARQKTRIATLLIRGLPEGAVVTIDGDEVGRAPAGPVRVGVGKHVVAATAVGYEAGEAKIEVAGEDRKVVELKLAVRVGQPLSAVPVASGSGLRTPRSALPAAPAPLAVPAAAPPVATAPAVDVAAAHPVRHAPAPAEPAAASTTVPTAPSNPATSEQTPSGASFAPAQGDVGALANASTGGGLRLAGLVGIGAGFVGLATGAILWEVAKSTNDDAVTQLKISPSQAHSTRSQAENLATGANVCLIAGGVLAGVGVLATLISFDVDLGRLPVAFAPAVGPSFAGVAANGVW